jgi:hypothetical protein
VSQETESQRVLFEEKGQPVAKTVYPVKKVLIGLNVFLTGLIFCPVSFIRGTGHLIFGGKNAKFIT